MSSFQPTKPKTYLEIGRNFLNISEGQFPINEPSQIIKFRTASDFANELNIHVNHLNRSVKLLTGHTTTENINQAILKEAKRLLRRNQWPIHIIAMVLAFKEATHFSNFFKRNIGMSPTEFRSEKVDRSQ